MLHCSCTTDVCIFMENVSSFHTFSQSHKLNLPRGWVYCLMDILNGVTQQVLQRALGITILSNLHKPGLVLNIFLEETCTPLDRRGYFILYIPRDFLPCLFVSPVAPGLCAVVLCCWGCASRAGQAGAHSWLSVCLCWSSSLTPVAPWCGTAGVS